MLTDEATSARANFELAEMARLLCCVSQMCDRNNGRCLLGFLPAEAVSGEGGRSCSLAKKRWMVSWSTGGGISHGGSGQNKIGEEGDG